MCLLTCAKGLSVHSLSAISLLTASCSWRSLGDDSCDKALRDVFSGPSSSTGKDLLKTLEEQASARSDTSNAAQDFLDEMNRAPPAGILASEEEIVLAQNFFLDNSIQIMQALLHYSLAGGFARSVAEIHLIRSY